MSELIQPRNVEELQAAVCSHPRLMARGRGTKTALTSPRPDCLTIDLCELSGLVEYQPSEYTFTALAGTPLEEVESALAANGQYLPFDPPFAERGATLGGTVAAGLSGPGRYRYGGVRDFLLGVKFVDGQGQLVRSGGKVVKNAAGFDLPKLMTGSLGQFGALVELTFKVFPRPAGTMTVLASYPQLETALADLMRLTCVPLDLYAFDMEAGRDGYSLQARLAGPPESFAARSARLRSLLEGSNRLEGEAEREHWAAARRFDWVAEGAWLAKVALTARRIPALEAHLEPAGALRRYSCGGNLAWIAWPGDIQELDSVLAACDLAGLALLGAEGASRLGKRSGASFARRIKSALDPQDRWVEV